MKITLLIFTLILLSGCETTNQNIDQNWNSHEPPNFPREVINPK